MLSGLGLPAGGGMCGVVFGLVAKALSYATLLAPFVLAIDAIAMSSRLDDEPELDVRRGRVI